MPSVLEVGDPEEVVERRHQSESCGDRRELVLEPDLQNSVEKRSQAIPQDE